MKVILMALVATAITGSLQAEEKDLCDPNQANAAIAVELEASRAAMTGTEINIENIETAANQLNKTEEIINTVLTRYGQEYVIGGIGYVAGAKTPEFIPRTRVDLLPVGAMLFIDKTANLCDPPVSMRLMAEAGFRARLLSKVSKDGETALKTIAKGFRILLVPTNWKFQADSFQQLDSMSGNYASIGANLQFKGNAQLINAAVFAKVDQIHTLDSPLIVEFGKISGEQSMKRTVNAGVRRVQFYTPGEALDAAIFVRDLVSGASSSEEEAAATPSEIQ
ncbi:MAG: hypothetical protein AB8E15_10400 [Bdellovibrionales bacterium]